MSAFRPFAVLQPELEREVSGLSPFFSRHFIVSTCLFVNARQAGGDDSWRRSEQHTVPYASYHPSNAGLKRNAELKSKACPAKYLLRQTDLCNK